MALLNPPEILPPLIRPIIEAAVMYGKPVDDDKLVVMLSPGAGDQPGSIGRAGKDHVRHTHAAARTLGLLQTIDGGSVPSEAAAEALERGSLRSAWPGLLRRALFTHPSADEAVRASVEQDTKGVSDLVSALTWFLAQDALDAPVSWDGSDSYRSFQQLQQQHFGDVTARYPIQNDTRFGAFERWSLHLGFAVSDERGNRALRPLPVDVVRSVIGGLQPGRYDVQDFCAGLGQAIPCLWPGFLRQQLVEAVGEDPDPDITAGGIDTSVALALATLEAEEVIRLDNLADASQRVVFAPRSRQPRSVTHVEVLA